MYFKLKLQETYMLKVSASLDGKGSDEVATTTT